MSKSKAAALVADNGPNDVAFYFYVSDAASGNKPRVRVDLLRNGVPIYSADHLVSDYQTITAQQKAGMLTVGQAIRDETLTLEGFA